MGIFDTQCDCCDRVVSLTTFSLGDPWAEIEHFRCASCNSLICESCEIKLFHHGYVHNASKYYQVCPRCVLPEACLFGKGKGREDLKDKKEKSLKRKTKNLNFPLPIKWIPSTEDEEKKEKKEKKKEKLGITPLTSKEAILQCLAQTLLSKVLVALVYNYLAFPKLVLVWEYGGKEYHLSEDSLFMTTAPPDRKEGQSPTQKQKMEYFWIHGGLWKITTDTSLLFVHQSDPNGNWEERLCLTEKGCFHYQTAVWYEKRQLIVASSCITKEKEGVGVTRLTRWPLATLNIPKKLEQISNVGLNMHSCCGDDFLMCCGHNRAYFVSLVSQIIYVVDLLSDEVLKFHLATPKNLGCGTLKLGKCVVEFASAQSPRRIPPLLLEVSSSISSMVYLLRVKFRINSLKCKTVDFFSGMKLVNADNNFNCLLTSPLSSGFSPACMPCSWAEKLNDASYQHYFMWIPDIAYETQEAHQKLLFLLPRASEMYCSGCGLSKAALKGEFLRCGRCLRSSYCGVACQTRGLESHKLRCVDWKQKFKEEREAGTLKAFFPITFT